MKKIFDAVNKSIAAKSTVTLHVADVEAAINYIHRTWVDVDHDSYPDRVTIFGAERFPAESPDSDIEGSFVLNLMRSVSLTANPFNDLIP
jgi:hypothetical protein